MQVEFGTNEAAIYRRLVQPDAPEILTLSDAREMVHGTVGSNSLSHTLSSLESKSILRRIGKGVYLNWSTGVAPKIVETIPRTFNDSEYYLGLNAMANFWGLSPQIARSYHVIYAPEDEAHSKKIRNWCSMLEKHHRILGGFVVPVTTQIKRGKRFEQGLSQSIVDGAQVFVSTAERTLVDSTIYTSAIGGAGESLTWAKAYLGMFQAGKADFLELEKLVEAIYPEVNSVVARLGFLLETARDVANIAVAEKSTLGNLLKKLQRIASRTRATYSWGPERPSARYFPKWHLRLSTIFAREISEAIHIE